MTYTPAFYGYDSKFFLYSTVFGVSAFFVGATVPTIGNYYIPIVVFCVLLMLYSLRFTYITIRKFFCRYNLIEIHDYCVIDTRTFKDWVYWEDVDEILILHGGAIGIIVQDEKRFARDPKNCLCDALRRSLGMPRLYISSFSMECTFPELLRAVHRASRPYNIPIRHQQ